MTLWNSAKETVRSRNHPSRGFRTPRNEDSQNLKPLPTSESAKTILSTSEAQELHPASWQAQKHIPCVHGSPGIPSLVRSLVLSGLVSCITLQPPSLLWSPFMHTWRHFHEAIWLERQQRGAWNKNGIGRWPDYFSPPRAKNRLGTRLPLTHVAVITSVYHCCDH